MRLLLVFLLLAVPAAAQPHRPAIVAAENFYGDVAAQIAGPDADVTSILSNPEQDPHLFEASPSVARALAGADLVIANGADYDPWMAKLLAASPIAARKVVIAAALAGWTRGGNPHLWYNPANMRAVAHAIAADLADLDPPHRAAVAVRLAAFDASLVPVDARIAALRGKYAGVPVTATEPVVGLLADALGLTMRNQRFQLAVMNDTEPRASDVAAFEADLRQRRVRVFFYNAQATDAAASRLLGIARTARIAVVGVSETEPPGTSYQAWMTGVLDAAAAALSR